MPPRLIETAFPLEATSLDSLHEKSVRHGHLSTLHLWPARRPLAACRATLLATLLADPASQAERERLLERIGGHIKQRLETKVLPGRELSVARAETVGGVLHWGNEAGAALDSLRADLRAAFGRPPRVLDPFAGGGAIPLEAMRLGCEASASDRSPVAWFLLRCTLEYPQRLAGQTWPLPDFARRDRGFMEAFLKSQKVPKTLMAGQLERLGFGEASAPELEGAVTAGQGLEADLAWQVRAWGAWVLEQARGDLARFYPTIAGEPPVAYLWARTVTCRNCRATLPLLKTRWLCKKDRKRILLTLTPNPERSGVVFGVQDLARQGAGSPAQRREDDKRRGAGTMSRAGARCPCCGQVSMSMEDIRLEGQAGRLGTVMTAVVVERDGTKAYRLPAHEEIAAAHAAAAELDPLYAEIPFGLPAEATPQGGLGAARAFSVQGYGLTRWCDLFTPRQLLALGTFVKYCRQARSLIPGPAELREAICAYLAAATDRLADYSSALCSWHNSGEKLRNTFGRFALPVVWDFAEVAPTCPLTGGFASALEWIARFLEHATAAALHQPAPQVSRASAIEAHRGSFDLILTDPPYYDAIPYCDLMNFFYVWLRRSLQGLSPAYDAAFAAPLDVGLDSELIDDASRFGGDAQRSKQYYENGMARAFAACHQALAPEGRLVIVFANKKPAAWETLVEAVIRAGFVVTASWPIRTEMSNRTRALASAALSSSVWLVCRKRAPGALPGWDEAVLEQMRANITQKLRQYWDAGIRGPDFVWAATGPALEAYSQHPVVKLAHRAGGVMSVAEFLRHARRMVVDFILGNVLSAGGGEAAALDDPTAYYLLHREAFHLQDAPAGACILYATSCNLTDPELLRRELLVRSQAKPTADEGEEADADADAEASPAAAAARMFRLRSWRERSLHGLGYAREGGRAVPLIDRVHRLLQLWAAGSQPEVDEYIDGEGLRRETLLPYVLQAVIELAGAESASDEQTKLEAVAKHLQARGGLIAEQGALLHDPIHDLD